MFQLDGERLLKRTVEHRIARGVGEVGQYDSVFVRQVIGGTRAEVENARDQSRDD